MRLPDCWITNGGGAGFSSFTSVGRSGLFSVAFFSASRVGFSAAAVAGGEGEGVGDGNIFGKNSRSCGSNFFASSGEENSIAIRNCGSLARAGQAANTIRELVSVSACALANFT